MGSPLALSLANICMCALERKYLKTCPSEFKPSLFRCYVDNSFCNVRNRQQDDVFLFYINFHENIIFMAELGNDNKLPFLDTFVTFNKNSFSTGLFHRKTFKSISYDFGSFTLHSKS